jgi:hypothetical protein
LKVAGFGCRCESAEMLITAATPTIPAKPANFWGKLIRWSDLINLFCFRCEYIFAFPQIAISSTLTRRVFRAAGITL